LKLFWISLKILIEKEQEMSKDLSNYYQAEAQMAVNYTRQILAWGASNKLYDQAVTLGTVNIGVLRTRITTFAGSITNGSGESTMDYWKRVARNASNACAGNCQEHAAVAFVYLMNRGVKPIEIVSVPNHAFVVVGRGVKPSETGDIGFPNGWADYCWISDPWRGRVIQGKQLWTYENGEPALECDYREALLRDYSKQK
jgi:hypothetical protein